MKRLLAYLFIVLGLGLVFSVSTKAWVVESIHLGSKKIYKIDSSKYKKHLFLSDTARLAVQVCRKSPEGKKNPKACVVQSINGTPIEKMIAILEPSLVEEIAPHLLLEETQIAKAEPNQTQKVAKKKNVGFAKSSLPKCIGSDDSKYTNCYGIYSNKIVAPGYTRNFEGEYGKIPGKREGRGSGTVYKEGKFFFSFIREYKNGKSYFGKEEWSTGFKYKGEYKNGIASFGELTYPAAEKCCAIYRGEFNVEGKPIGFARLTDTKDYTVFVGDVIDGLKSHGLGFGYRDNKKQFAAIFENDIPRKGISWQQLEILQDKEKAFLKRELNLLVKGKVLSECNDLGFITRTQEYADCDLKLTVLYKEEAIEEQKTIIVEEQTRFARRQARDSNFNSNAKPKLYYDSFSGGMRECAYDASATGKCLSFKAYNASLFDKDTLFYDPSSGKMKTCLGIVTVAGKCTSFGMFNHSKATADKGQLYYDPKNKKMTTCSFVTLSGECTMYDLVPNKWSKNRGVFKEPGSDITFKEPGSDITFKEPGSDITFSEPGSSVTFSEPGSSVTFSEPGSGYNF